MVEQGKFTFANLDWNAALKNPAFIRGLLPKDNSVRAWLLAQIEKHNAPVKEVEIIRKPVIRARDDKVWIKKNNFQFSGIRKRKPEGRMPTFKMNRPATHAQYQRHSVHLLSNILNVRSNASPFTLVIDDLNQRAMPFVGELIRRALSRNVNVIVVALEGTHFHPAVRTVRPSVDDSAEQILKDISEAMDRAKESIVIVDHLYELVNVKNVDMVDLFNLVAIDYASTLVGVYHQDMVPSHMLVPRRHEVLKTYLPSPLSYLKHFATAVINCKSFAHVLAAKAAKERSLEEPTHGLLHEAEGVVQSLDANDNQGIVLEAEFRRQSGREESEVFFLRTARPADYNVPLENLPYGTLRQEFVILLEQQPTYNNKEVIGDINARNDIVEATFKLSLTDKQKQAREGVVLPYTDAQKGEGGEGGRILYDMGAEDDFDEEEDEI
ncbi:hypothetical protein N0V83_005488 [Neocucurbitaria cava]|uniref:Elongator complex protein 5 n=1 Tax=Neocucurbitaria cava TaxID=798079 RepID=A0A9W8YA69_9PLEO|nr:hypothetical protein N0V83_005488 [Neocucurbitaria cava]